MSKQEPLIGPRNASPSERASYQAKDFFMVEDVAFMTAGLSIIVAILGRMALKTEKIQSGSLKKAAQSFVVISLGGMAAHAIKNNMKK